MANDNLQRRYVEIFRPSYYGNFSCFTVFPQTKQLNYCYYEKMKIFLILKSNFFQYLNLYTSACYQLLKNSGNLKS